MRITEEWLKGKAACQDQVDLFVKTFPDGADASEASIALAGEVGLDLSWLFDYVVRAPARAEYEKITAPARAEYEKIRDAAWDEYEKIGDAAWAEYEKIRDAAWAELEKIRSPARAEYEKIRDAARAELEKIRAPARASAIIRSMREPKEVLA